jgi:hypothetical protein
MIELNREQPLFETILPINYHATHCEAKTSPLSFRILEGSRQGQSENSRANGQQNPNHVEKIIHFEVHVQLIDYLAQLFSIIRA